MAATTAKVMVTYDGGYRSDGDDEGDVDDEDGGGDANADQKKLFSMKEKRKMFFSSSAICQKEEIESFLQ